MTLTPLRAAQLKEKESKFIRTPDSHTTAHNSSRFSTCTKTITVPDHGPKSTLSLDGIYRGAELQLAGLEVFTASQRSLSPQFWRLITHCCPITTTIFQHLHSPAHGRNNLGGLTRER